MALISCLLHLVYIVSGLDSLVRIYVVYWNCRAGFAHLRLRYYFSDFVVVSFCFKISDECVVCIFYCVQLQCGNQGKIVLLHVYRRRMHVAPSWGLNHLRIKQATAAFRKIRLVGENRQKFSEIIRNLCANLLNATIEMTNICSFCTALVLDIIHMYENMQMDFLSLTYHRIQWPFR